MRKIIECPECKMPIYEGDEDFCFFCQSSKKFGIENDN